MALHSMASLRALTLITSLALARIGGAAPASNEYILPSSLEDLNHHLTLQPRSEPYCRPVTHTTEIASHHGKDKHAHTTKSVYSFCKCENSKDYSIYCDGACPWTTAPPQHLTFSPGHVEAAAVEDVAGGKKCLTSSHHLQHHPQVTHHPSEPKSTISIIRDDHGTYEGIIDIVHATTTHPITTTTFGDHIPPAWLIHAKADKTISELPPQASVETSITQTGTARLTTSTDSSGRKHTGLVVPPIICWNCVPKIDPSLHVKIQVPKSKICIVIFGVHIGSCNSDSDSNHKPPSPPGHKGGDPGEKKTKASSDSSKKSSECKKRTADDVHVECTVEKGSNARDAKTTCASRTSKVTGCSATDHTVRSTTTTCSKRTAYDKKIECVTNKIKKTHSCKTVTHTKVGCDVSGVATTTTSTVSGCAAHFVAGSSTFCCGKTTMFNGQPVCSLEAGTMLNHDPTNFADNLPAIPIHQLAAQVSSYAVSQLSARPGGVHTKHHKPSKTELPPKTHRPHAPTDPGSAYCHPFADPDDGISAYCTCKDHRSYSLLKDGSCPTTSPPASLALPTHRPHVTTDAQGFIYNSTNLADGTIWGCKSTVVVDYAGFGVTRCTGSSSSIGKTTPMFPQPTSKKSRHRPPPSRPAPKPACPTSGDGDMPICSEGCPNGFDNCSPEGTEGDSICNCNAPCENVICGFPG